MKNYVREERNDKNLTQAQLAEMVNVSRQSIISIETNRYMPSILLCLKLAKALGKRVDDLFKLEDLD